MYSYYSFGEKIKNIKALMYTKLFWRTARLIRLPVFVRNKNHLIYGSGLTTGYNLRIEASEKSNSIYLGKNVIIGDYCHIVGRNNLKIGDNVLIASRVYISDTSHGSYNETLGDDPNTIPNERKLVYKEIEIGNNVWIGENVCILPGVKIGDGCVVGANTVVTKSFDNNSIIVGNPGRVIKKYDDTSYGWRIIE